MKEERIPNPIDRKQILMMFAIVGVFMTFGAFDALTGGGTRILIVASLLSGLVCISFIYREIIHRPKTIILRGSDGFSMVFLSGKRMEQLYADVCWIDALPGTRSRDEKDWSRDGIIKIMRRYPFPLTYESADSLRREFFQLNGHFPLTRNEYRKRKRDLGQIYSHEEP
jgi:hypothetical protein